jgi:hypothetical protein
MWGGGQGGTRFKSTYSLHVFVLMCFVYFVLL